MARKIDPLLADILRQYECDPAADIWDCHGTWVAYHRTLEKIAAKAGIQFDAPIVVEASGAAGIVTVIVTGRMGQRSEWSFGECSPKNNKNAYPYSMAEKRGKDRVIIKLVGLHGVYSEDEADDFKEAKPEPRAAANDAPVDDATMPDVADAMIRALWSKPDRPALEAWFKANKDAIEALADVDRVKISAELAKAGARFPKKAA